MEEKRSEKFTMRLTPTEKKKLTDKSKKANMTATSLLLSAVEDKKIVVAEKIPQLVLEITRIGTNINQIAHIGNSQKFVNTKQLSEVINLMEEIKMCMQKILSEIYNEDEHNFKSLERKIDMLLERNDTDGNS